MTERSMQEIRSELQAADEEYSLNYTEEQGDFVDGYNKNREVLVAELLEWFSQNSTID